MAHYMVVDRTSNTVINFIEWDGVANISFLTDNFEVSPTPNTAINIGWVLTNNVWTNPSPNTTNKTVP